MKKIKYEGMGMHRNKRKVNKKQLLVKKAAKRALKDKKECFNKYFCIYRSPAGTYYDLWWKDPNHPGVQYTSSGRPV